MAPVVTWFARVRGFVPDRRSGIVLAQRPSTELESHRMRRHGSFWGSLLGVSALALATATAAQKDPVDEGIARQVRSALAASGVDVGGVEVSVDHAVVTLHGEVKDAREKIWLLEAAFAVQEVRAVESELVLRSSGTPDVEEAIWLALFDDGLDRFLSEVLVRGGVATLRGEVPDAAIRERILTTARGIEGVDSVREELSIATPAESPTAAPAESAPPAGEAPPAPETATASPASPPLEPMPEPKEPSAPEPVPPDEATPPDETPGTTERPAVTSEAPPPRPAAEPPAPAAPAPRRPTPPSSNAARSESLVRSIVAGILGYSGYTVFDHIQFGLEGRDVVLRGVVTEPSKKREIEEILRGVSGVGEVQNDIRILPNSDADRKLREKLFQRIYEDALFAEFADERNPPVHILVENGWVTLTGVVDDVLQKMSAEGRVRTVFGVMSVRNQIRVRE